MNYRQILFDMDGVITQELFYWKAAAATAWDLLFEDAPAQIAAREDEIYDTVLCGGETVSAAKDAGVNTNNDLCYVVTALYTHFRDFSAVCDFLKTQTVPALYDRCGELTDGVWSYQGERCMALYDRFQQWYLGDGKDRPGFVQRDEPLFPVPKLTAFFDRLKAAGVCCGVGTGRFRAEILPQLERWGLLPCFDPEHIVTETEIEQAQRYTAEQGAEQKLNKPHYYIFGKAMAGLSCPDGRILRRDWDATLTETTLIVGDAAADLFAARNLGADFAAVLTGKSGKAGRRFFEEQHAEYIFDDVFGLESLL